MFGRRSSSCGPAAVEIIDEPRVIFSHTGGSLGPADNDEWMAFIRDSEGNTVGLASFEPRHDPMSR